jgi:hypothetical protein
MGNRARTFVIAALVAATASLGAVGAVDPAGAGVPGSGSITIVKDARPDHPQDFGFSVAGAPGSFAATLDDDDDPTLPDSVTFTVQPGAYDVRELTSFPAGWTVAGISCDNGATAPPTDPSLDVVIQAGDHVTCTFTNDFRQPDALIRRWFGGGILGDDVYNADGAGQTTSSQLRRLQSRIYDIRIENDGLADDFLVQGPPGGDGFRVRYLLGWQDVTGLVTGSGLPLTDVPEHGVRHLLLVIRAKHDAAPGSTQDVLVTVASATGIDAVRAQVTVVPWFGHL